MNYARHIGEYIVAVTREHRIFRGILIDYLTAEENDVESIIIRRAQDNQLIELPLSDLISTDTASDV